VSGHVTRVVRYRFRAGFARTIDAVPDATVLTVFVLFVGLGTLVFANLVAVSPGLSAAHPIGTSSSSRVGRFPN
jgi:hypothetical protein